MSIEVAERAQASGKWAPSGIFRAKEPFYVQGDKATIWTFPTHMLRSYARSIGVDWDLDNWVLLDEQGRVREYNGTMRRFYLDYGPAEEIGGVCLVC